MADGGGGHIVVESLALTQRARTGKNAARKNNASFENLRVEET